jgi:amidase
VIVSRFKAAGLVPFGKTNVPELVLSFTTESDLYGPARNPWNLEHSSGGSSGGSAAAVAAGIVPLAHGADGGGSIRVPASCCGLVGLKPTRGRTSYSPDHGDVWDGFEVQGVLSRSVRDTAAALDVIGGGAAGDPYATPLGPDSYLKAIARPPKRLRIAFTTKRADGSSTHPDCAAAVTAAVALCAQLGHEVDEDAPALGAYDAFFSAFIAIVAANIAASVDAVAAVTNATPSSDLFQANTWRVYELGKGLSAVNYLRAKSAIHMLGLKMAQFHQRYDVFLMPTLGMPPMRLGTWRNDERDATKMDPPFAAYANTPLQNATGQPAVNLPLHWNGSNLPIGVHFAGRFGNEETLLRLAAQLEHAAPWSHHYTQTGL